MKRVVRPYRYPLDRLSLAAWELRFHINIILIVVSVDSNYWWHWWRVTWSSLPRDSLPEEMRIINVTKNISAFIHIEEKGKSMRSLFVSVCLAFGKLCVNPRPKENQTSEQTDGKDSRVFLSFIFYFLFYSWINSLYHFSFSSNFKKISQSVISYNVLSEFQMNPKLQREPQSCM